MCRRDRCNSVTSAKYTHQHKSCKYISGDLDSDKLYSVRKIGLDRENAIGVRFLT